MNPKEMLEALIGRDESVLTQIASRYGPYVRKTAFQILRDEEDVREVENDVWLKLWHGEVPEDPEELKARLGLYSRQLAIDRLRIKSAARRGRGEYALALEELEEALPDPSQQDPADRLALKEAMSRFLKGLPKRDRQLFVCRYWYGLSVKECAEAFSLGESAVKAALLRIRKKLKQQLEKEEIPI